jgi:hypothetical protein
MAPPGSLGVVSQSARFALAPQLLFGSPQSLRNLPYQRGQEVSHSEDDRECERLLRWRHVQLLGATEQRDMRKRQPVAADLVKVLDVPIDYVVACQGSRASILLMG